MAVLLLVFFSDLHKVMKFSPYVVCCLIAAFLLGKFTGQNIMLFSKYTYNRYFTHIKLTHIINSRRSPGVGKGSGKGGG